MSILVQPFLPPQSEAVVVCLPSFPKLPACEQHCSEVESCGGGSRLYHKSFAAGVNSFLDTTETREGQRHIAISNSRAGLNCQSPTKRCKGFRMAPGAK